MREAAIVATARTGMAKSFRGSFNLTRPDDLAALCVKDLLKQVPELDPAAGSDLLLVLDPQLAEDLLVRLGERRAPEPLRPHHRVEHGGDQDVDGDAAHTTAALTDRTGGR